MSDEFSPEFIELMKKSMEAWPYKRIVVPQHMLDRYNAEFGKDGQHTVSLAVTVAKDATFTEEEFWDLLVKTRDATKDATPLDFGDLDWKSEPPVTGRPKTQLR